MVSEDAVTLYTSWNSKCLIVYLESYANCTLLCFESVIKWKKQSSPQGVCCLTLSSLQIYLICISNGPMWPNLVKSFFGKVSLVAIWPKLCRLCLHVVNTKWSHNVHEGEVKGKRNAFRLFDRPEVLLDTQSQGWFENLDRKRKVKCTKSAKAEFQLSGPIHHLSCVITLQWTLALLDLPASSINQNERNE